jgi:hypothetical protein
MPSTTGQVRAAEAEEGRDNPEEAAEVRLQARVPVLFPLFRGHQEAEAVVHRAEAAALRCQARREGEVELRQQQTFARWR